MHRHQLNLHHLRLQNTLHATLLILRKPSVVVVRRDTSVTLSIGMLPDQQARDCETVCLQVLDLEGSFAFKLLENPSSLGTKP